MGRPRAILVEDDEEQAVFSRGILEEAGFAVNAFTSSEEALEEILGTNELIDLFVLDRRLPPRVGDPASDEVGDGLLAEVRVAHPDAMVIVFTGYASVRHIQASLGGGGPLPSLAGISLDRIKVFEKNQAPEFRAYVEDYGRLIQSLEDIELLPSGVFEATDDELAKRALRRVGAEYGAACVRYEPLAGGLTGANVWLCELLKADGPVATIVVKATTKGPPQLDVAESLPRGRTVATLRTFSGLVGQVNIRVLQVAGVSSYALMEVIERDPHRAVALCQPLWADLDAIVATRRVVPLSELCRPLIEWDAMERVLEPYGVAVPAGSLLATAYFGMRHGDLHPGNILIVGEDAVLIDLDSSDLAAGALDPATLLISTLVHPASPFSGAGWLSSDSINSQLGKTSFGLGHPQEVWFRAISAWLAQRCASEREFWAVLLAYVSRQLSYADVVKDPEVVVRLVAIAQCAARAIDAT